MSSINIISSSSEEDDKKRKRKISNRESARRSRMKREQHMKDLNDQIAYFGSKSCELARKIDEIGRRYAAAEAENRILRLHGEELKKRLQLLEEMADSYSKNSCINVEEDDGDCFVRDVLKDFDLERPWLHPAFQSQAVDGIYQF
ncbi:bZIP transcription factor 44-like [Salvia divinorum]|uniref:BZIP transcription factor 44-like n=1 Tax=Salvia divinorum TaxID=28513 RepID=A0ABD1GWN3_SALDI